MDEKHLHKVEIFQDLSPDDLRELAELFFEVSVPADHTLFQTSHPPRSFFVVREGAVELYREGTPEPVLVERRGPGDHLGEFGIFEKRKRDLIARTVVPSTILEITREDLLKFIEKHPMVALRLNMAASRHPRPIDLSSPGAKKRQARRTPIGKRVTLMLDDSTSCVTFLDDLSTEGFRIEGLPPGWDEVHRVNRFHLAIGAAMLQLSARTIWQRGSSAGLEFVKRSRAHDMKIQWALRQLLAADEPEPPGGEPWKLLRTA